MEKSGSELCEYRIQARYISMRETGRVTEQGITLCTTPPPLNEAPL